jgi:hypothetical protein
MSFNKPLVYNPNPNIPVGQIQEKKKEKKPLLFISNFCSYSNELYQNITKNGIKDKFVIINVSDKSLSGKIPNIIKSVPTILLRNIEEIEMCNGEKILKDIILEKYIELISNKKNEDEIRFNDSGGGFAPLDMEDMNGDIVKDGIIGGISIGYSGVNENINITTPNQDTDQSKIGGTLSDNMNSMMEERGRDIERLFPDKKKMMENNY